MTTTARIAQDAPRDLHRAIDVVMFGLELPRRVERGLVALLQRSARGDQESFARLYDATSARVHGLILRVLGDPEQSEEVTQDVFVEIWRQSARYDESAGSPLAWMMR